MEAIQYVALERVGVGGPVDRISYIAGLAKSKRIFDLGALDETAYQKKQANGRWLHAQLCEAASEVIGIDNSSLLPDEGLVTAGNGRIIRADIFDLSPVVNRCWKPDMLVAGELIEHLPNTLDWLRSLKANPDLEGVGLVFSTPNACSWYNGLIGLFKRESTHPDHLQIYSYKTLRTLFDRSGLRLDALVPYHVRFDEMRESSRGLKRAAVGAFQAGINVLESITPMLSGGWVGVARI